MHLVCNKTHTVTLGGTSISIKKGESIWTESSYKYTLNEFAQLAGRAGFKVERVWLDEDALFSVQYLTTSSPMKSGHEHMEICIGTD